MLGLLFLLCFATSKLYAQQKIRLKFEQAPLNQVIIFLINQHNLQASFNDDKLSQYLITVDKSFDNSHEALEFVLKDSPFKQEQNRGVCVITAKKENKKILSGVVMDGKSRETLPYASVFINGYHLTTDAQGRFAYQLSGGETYQLRVSYLGYFRMDTLIRSQNNLQVFLHEKTIKMRQMTFISPRKQLETSVGPGQIKLNNYVHQNLPGGSNSSVYNLLRLQPGILAAGENVKDLLMWGSYRGQTKVTFDGFTVFGLKNFNDNIGAINPLIAKDLSVYKGGYGAEYGDRVGGVVNIIGMDGNVSTPKIKLGINNLTLNGVASTPVFKNTALYIAGRKTYYNLYQELDISPTPKKPNKGAKKLAGYRARPDYDFKDFNIKFSGKSKRSEHYYISMFQGMDYFSSNYTLSTNKSVIDGSNDERNRQFGASGFYSKQWKNGSITNVTVAHSGLKRKIDQDIDVFTDIKGNQADRSKGLTINKIIENEAKVTHRLPQRTYGHILLGSGYIKNQTALTRDSLQENRINEIAESDRLFFFAEDRLQVTSKLSLTPGLRTDFNSSERKLYFQPRFGATYQINKPVQISASWGIYKQFIARSTEKNAQGDMDYFWTINDGKELPVYHAQHWVLGFKYQKDDLWINTDFYYKTSNGLIRYFEPLPNHKNRTSQQGQGRSYGMDVLIRKEYRGSSIWLGYSLSQTLERYIQQSDGEYGPEEPAPQDQRHELKAAGILKLSPFYFSANYVYGSGFPARSPDLSPFPFNRFDVAFTYQFAVKNYNFQTGISILNLFNTANIRTEDYKHLSLENVGAFNIYSQGVPFTPTISFSFEL